MLHQLQYTEGHTRADIDALNLTEENDLPYKSQTPKKVHACGHDAQTAMLLGAAKVIYQNRSQITGNKKTAFSGS